MAYSQEQIIQQFNDIHKQFYDYSKVEYKSTHEPITIICPIHDEFEQRPSKHKKGQGCPKCAKQKRIDNTYLTQNDVIKDFHKQHGKELFDYSKVIYKGIQDDVIIHCNTCNNDFTQTPDHHKRGSGCSHCSHIKTSLAKYKKSSEKIIKDFYNTHGERYDYSLVRFTKMVDKVEIICKEHGIFTQAPMQHKKGQGCPKCVKNFWDGSTYKNRRTTLYYIKVNNLYKIGLTLSDVKSRFIKDTDVVIDIIREWVFEDGQEAYIIEQSILSTYKDYQYKGDKILIGGNTELFNKDILSQIESLVFV